MDSVNFFQACRAEIVRSKFTGKNLNIERNKKYNNTRQTSIFQSQPSDKNVRSQQRWFIMKNRALAITKS